MSLNAFGPRGLTYNLAANTNSNSVIVSLHPGLIALDHPKIHGPRAVSSALGQLFWAINLS